MCRPSRYPMGQPDQLSSPFLFSDSDLSIRDESPLNTPSTECGFGDGDIEDDRCHRSDSDKRYTLVTGGLGYIGSHTLLELLKAGNNVIVIDDLSNSSLVVLKRIRHLVYQHYATLGCNSVPSLELYQFDYGNTRAVRSLLDQYLLQPFESINHKRRH